MVFDVLFFSVVLPFLLALVFQVGGHFRTTELSSRGAISVGFSVVGAFLAVYFWIKGVPDMPPVGANGWLFVVAVDVAALAILEALVKKPAVIWTARLLLVSLGLRMILDSKFQNGWSAEQGYIHVGALSALGMAQWASFERLSRRSGGPVFGLVMAGFAGFSALILGLASSATLAQMAGAISIAALVSAVASWKFKGFAFAALVSSVVPLVLMLAVISRVYADLPNLPFVLIALLPFTVWLGEIGPWRQNVLARAAMHLIAIAVPVSVAAWLLVTTSVDLVPTQNSLPATSEGVDEPYDPYAAGGADDEYDPYAAGENDSE